MSGRETKPFLKGTLRRNPGGTLGRAAWSASLALLAFGVLQSGAALGQPIEPPDVVSIATLMALMDSGDVSGAQAYVREHGLVQKHYPNGSTDSAGRRLDNGNVVYENILRENCVGSMVAYLKDRVPCALLAGDQKAQCLENAKTEQVAYVDKLQTDNLEDRRDCGFRYPRFSEALATDLAFLAERKREAEEANKNATKQAKLRRDAEERARAKAAQDPAYQRAGLSGQLCDNQRQLEQIRDAERQSAHVDGASGTVSLSQRRRLSEAKVYLGDENKRLRSKYRRLRGKNVNDWCSLPSTDDIYEDILRSELAQ